MHFSANPITRVSDPVLNRKPQGPRQIPEVQPHEVAPSLMESSLMGGGGAKKDVLRELQVLRVKLTH